MLVAISSVAVEGPSGLCLGPIDGSAQGTGALCTAHCESDDDCENNETAPRTIRPTTPARFAEPVNSEAGGLPISDEATLDSYGRVGNMAPPFGLWLSHRFSRGCPSEIPQDAAKESP
jgi:hypothetical protein